MTNTLQMEAKDVLFKDVLTDEELLVLQQIFEKNKESWRKRRSPDDFLWDYRERKERLNSNFAYKKGEESRIEIERELISKHIEEGVIFLPVRHSISESMTRDTISVYLCINHFRNGTIPMSDWDKKKEEAYYDRFAKLSDDDKLRFAERQLKLLDMIKFNELSKELSEKELTAVFKEIVSLISKRDDYTDRYFEDNVFRKLEEAVKINKSVNDL